MISFGQDTLAADADAVECLERVGFAAPLALLPEREHMLSIVAKR